MVAGPCFPQQLISFPGCEVQAIANGTASREVGSVVPDDETVTYSCNEGYSLDDAARLDYILTLYLPCQVRIFQANCSAVFVF